MFLFAVVYYQDARQNEKVIAQSVDVSSQQIVYFDCLCKTDYQPFCSAAHRASHMALGSGQITSGDNEGIVPGQTFVESIYLSFQYLLCIGRQLGQTCINIGILGCKKGLDNEQFVLNILQYLILLLRDGSCQFGYNPHMGIELVDGSVGLHPRVAFQHPCAAYQRGLAFIACLCVYHFLE